MKFRGGFDIAIAVVEINKGTSHLSDQEIEEFTASLKVPDIKPIDLINTVYKFAFIPGYPAKIYKSGKERFADY